MLVVSTDPAHSLSDSLAQVRIITSSKSYQILKFHIPLPSQDVSGGKPVLVAGTDLPLWGMEIDPEEGRREFMQEDASGSNPGR